MLLQPSLSKARCFSSNLQSLALGIFAFFSVPAINATEQIAALPSILNYYPVCEQTPLKKQTKTHYLTDYKLGDTERTEKAKSILFLELRQEAAAEGADALILTKIWSAIELEDRNHKRVRLKIEGTASFIKFCEGNTELSKRPTRFSEFGTFQNANTTTFRITTDTTPKMAAEPAVLPTLGQDVSVSHGVFGVLPGMTRNEVEQRFGKADTEIQLPAGGTALGYGRNFWLVFHDVLQQIQTERKFLSGYGQNLLELHDHFDSNNWLLNSKVGYKSQIKDVRQQLPALTNTDAYQLQQSNQQYQLLLNFEKYSLVHQQPAELLLTGFLLKNAATKVLPLQIPEVNPTLYHQVLKQMQPATVQQSPDWTALSIPADLPRHQFKTEQGQWLILGDYIQLQVNDEQIKKLRIADSVFYRPAQTVVFQKLYQALGLPAHKQQLLSMFNDGEFYHRQFNVYRDGFHLQISFDSDTEDAKPEELILSYF